MGARVEAMGDALRLDTVGLPMPVHARGASRAIWGRMVWTKVRVRAAMLQYAYAAISYMVPTTHRVRLGFAAVELGASA